MNSEEIIDAIKEQVELIEAEIGKDSKSAKQRCRAASTKIKNLAADFKRGHK